MKPARDSGGLAGDGHPPPWALFDLETKVTRHSHRLLSREKPDAFAYLVLEDLACTGAHFARRCDLFPDWI